MSLSHVTIKKLMRETFTGEKPIHVAEADKAAIRAQIKDRLTSLNNIRIENEHNYYPKTEPYEFLIGFTIEDPHDRYALWRQNFRLMVDMADKLVIRHSGRTAFISDLEELISFIDTCQDRLDRQNAKKNKRQKVRDLKKQAIIAQIKKIAKEDKFDFCTDTDTVKLKLYIRLSKEDREAIRLDIPFSKFQAVLPQLRQSIQSLRDLYHSGIKFKLESPRYYRSSWIEHESL